MIKLTELKGAENLPGKREVIQPTYKASHQNEGFSLAVSQMESCGIKVNEVVLENKIIGIELYFIKQLKRRPDYNELVKALAESAGEYLEIEVIK